MTRGGEGKREPQARGIYAALRLAAGDDRGGLLARAKGGWSKVAAAVRRVTAVPLSGGVFSTPGSFRTVGPDEARQNDRPSMASLSPATQCLGWAYSALEFLSLAVIEPAVWVLPGDPPYTGAEGVANVSAARFSHPAVSCLGLGLTGAATWRESGKAEGTVGTVRTPFPIRQSHWPFARSGLFPLAFSQMGTVRTARASLRGRKMRALVASPPRTHRSGGAEL